MKQRLIHFERIDPEYGEIGFYCGYHNLASFTEDEKREFDDLMDELFGPRMNQYRNYKFFFTLDGFPKYKKLIRSLIQVIIATIFCITTYKRISCFTQVIFKKPIAGPNETSILGFKLARRMLRPSKFSILLGNCSMVFKTINGSNFSDNTGGKHRTNARNRGQGIRSTLKLAFNLFV